MEERIRQMLPQVVGQGDMERIVHGLQLYDISTFEQLVALRKIHLACADRLTPEAEEYFNRQVEALRDFIEVRPEPGE